MYQLYAIFHPAPHLWQAQTKPALPLVLLVDALSHKDIITLSHLKF